MVELGCPNSRRWAALLALALPPLASGCSVDGTPRRTSAAGPAGALALETEATGLRAPTGVEFRPGDRERLYVLEQDGRVMVVERGKVAPRPFLDLRDSVLSGGERGLLGLAFAPDHRRTGHLYVQYTNRKGDTRVVRYRAKGDRVDPDTGRDLLRVDQPYENHNGGRLAFGPDGRLYLGLGDGGSAFDPHQRGQDLRTRLGKLLRLDVRRPRARWRTVAYGLRNPWRISFDRLTGDLWIGDVGQDRVEEVDVLPARQRGLVNFGWSAYEGRVRQAGRRLNRRGRLAWPVVTYGRRHGCSITGGFVYRGRAIPSLRGRYVYGDLCQGTVWSLRRAGRRADVRQEPIRLPLVTSFAEDHDGELHAVSHDGKLVAIVPARGGSSR